MHAFPPKTATGLSDWIGEPMSSSSWLKWSTWPLSSMYEIGVPFAVGATPAPPTIAAVGLIVTLVAFSAATTSRNGVLYPACPAATAEYASTAM